MDPLNPSPLSIPNPIKSAAIARSSHVAVEDETGSWTYGELLDEIQRRAQELKMRGVQPGDIVSLKGAYDRRWVRDLHAIGWLGAAVAPLDPLSTNAMEDKRLSTLKPDHQLESHASTDRVEPLLEERFWSPDDIRIVTTTSGTTGEPKVISLTTGQILMSAFASATRLGLDPQDRWLACLPLHHVGGLSILFRSAFYGTTCVVHSQFDAKRVAASLDTGSVHVVSLVPTMLNAVLDARDDAPFPKTLRAILLGGAPAGSTLLARAKSLQIPLSTTWGMTEAASQVATAYPGEFSTDGSVGPPLPFTRVMDKGETLEIAGPLVGGHFRTSDRGDLSADGQVRIDGRNDHVIISGGKNIHPEELEASIASHPAIAEAGVIGVPDEKWGERVVAVLVSNPGDKPLSSEEIMLWCKEHLGAHQAPKEVHWRGELPRNAMGKLSRDQLRKEICP